jgi:hypothetical protein
LLDKTPENAGSAIDILTESHCVKSRANAAAST